MTQDPGDRKSSLGENLIKFSQWQQLANKWTWARKEQEDEEKSLGKNNKLFDRFGNLKIWKGCWRV